MKTASPSFWGVIILFLLELSLPVSGQLSRSGSKIINGAGEEVLLRGYGLGGWLVPEGYQLHIPGFGSPTVIREMIVSLIGEENTAEFESAYRENYVTEADIAQIKAWGFNSIRLPFNYRLLSPEHQPGVLLDAGFELIDTVLDWCEAHELYLILDMHCAPGGQSKDPIADADGIEARLWTEPANQDRIVALWTALATRYVGEPWIGGYDLINEPVLPSGFTGSDLRALYLRILAAIRPIDPDHLVFIEGNWYATDFSGLTPPFDTQMVYAFHKYWNENAQSSIQYLLNMRQSTHIPLWLGESGENSNVWFANCVALMEQHGIGWNWWTHKKVATITSPYSASITPEYQKVLDYWNNTGPKPSLDIAKKGLMEMAQGLKQSACALRPGVVPALLDPTYRSLSRPLQDHHIPGRIVAVDYDLGTQGVAYWDKDYQNAPGVGNSYSWNTGWQYRNDGVDIETSQDENGPAYSIGWTEAGEWLLYTFDVSEAGLYALSLRTAANGANGRCSIELDGNTTISTVNIPNSGGWYNWQNTTVGNVALSRGTHRLKVYIIQSGFNFSAIDLTLLQTTVTNKDVDTENAASIWLGQNYPNPISSHTTIPFQLIKASAYRLSICDSVGKIVRTWISGGIKQGRMNIMWDGCDQAGARVASGVYFYRLTAGDYIVSRSLIIRH